jgi:hypothetical protein
MAHAVQGAMSGQPDPRPLLDLAAKEADLKIRGRLQAGAVILASLGWEMSAADRSQLDRFELGRGQANAAQLIALSLAAASGLKGETALLALQVAQAGGEAGPGPVDRYWIIRALERVGLGEDAQALAVEGLTAQFQSP